MEAFPDYYGDLGVPRYTDAEGIRRAYLRKAWQHHPDVHPDSPEAVETMSGINVAFSILSDPVRRAEYDARRTVVHLRPHPSTGGPYQVSRSRYRYPMKRACGILDSALSMFTRFIRYATAILPL